MSLHLRCAASGAAAGAVNGFFGAGGGMILVPLLGRICRLPENQIFPASLSIMFPICAVSLLMTEGPLPLKESLPYVIGSGIGGLIAAGPGRRISPRWLHRLLGVLILLGGGRMLCS